MPGRAACICFCETRIDYCLNGLLRNELKQKEDFFLLCLFRSLFLKYSLYFVCSFMNTMLLPVCIAFITSIYIILR